MRLIEDGRSRAYAVERGTGRYPGRREAHRAESTPFLVAIAVDAEGRARPVDGPTIYSHLPTGERSGLRFLLHARFDVPLDRERLDLSSPWNRWALLESAPLFARAVADLAGRGGDGVLGVIPLPEELADDAYRDLARAVASALADIPLLRGAGGELLAPRAALTAGDARLARALAGVDVGGRRVLGPLGRRDTEVAHMLGARPLTGDDVVAAIARDAASRDGERFEAPWGAAGLAELAEVIGPDDSIDVASLAAARFLPDHEGRARRPSELLRATGELAELLAGVRPLVAGELAGPGAARLLDRVGARAARTQDLVDQLLRPDAAAAIVASAGAARVLAHLAAAPPGDLAGVRAARVVPVAPRGDMPWAGPDAGQMARSGPLEPRRREVHEGGPASSKVPTAEHGRSSAWPHLAAGGSDLSRLRGSTGPGRRSSDRDCGWPSPGRDRRGLAHRRGAAGGCSPRPGDGAAAVRPRDRARLRGLAPPAGRALAGPECPGRPGRRRPDRGERARGLAVPRRHRRGGRPPGSESGGASGPRPHLPRSVGRDASPAPRRRGRDRRER